MPQLHNLFTYYVAHPRSNWVRLYKGGKEKVYVIWGGAFQFILRILWKQNILKGTEWISKFKNRKGNLDWKEIKSKPLYRKRNYRGMKRTKDNSRTFLVPLLESVFRIHVISFILFLVISLIRKNESNTIAKTSVDTMFFLGCLFLLFFLRGELFRFCFVQNTEMKERRIFFNSSVNS